MNNRNEISDIVNRQRAFFRSGSTKDVSFRLDRLARLKRLLKDNESLFMEALESDFQKPGFETYGTELGQVYEELNLCRKKLKKWARPDKVSGSMFNFPSRNFIHYQPYGTVLVIGTWNYPIKLTFHPAISAIAAGNTVILKPSELAGQTSSLMAQLIDGAFDPGFFTVVEGAGDVGQQLLEQPLDYIFFTGSAPVGKSVMKAASEQLVPVTLELGGKSPVIVDETADLAVSARRIVWGKFMNAGQTCVAPDYLYVQSAVKDTLVGKMKGAIRSFYGPDPSDSPDYPRIINERNFLRLTRLLEQGTVIAGGQTDPDGRYIAPTIIDNVTWNHPVMEEEIFGPILPILTFDEMDEVINEINARPIPLSLYLFSERSSHQQKVIKEIEFGGGCINDTLVHLGNLNLPFGGKGRSGMGNYYGKFGFDTFSQKKSILKKPTWLDIPLRYPPYKDHLKWLKKIFN